MLQAFVITLREGLEAFLIVAISLAYLRKSGRRELVPAVHWAIALSLFISIGAAYLFQRAANHALWEGVLAIVAAVSVASLTVHMWRTARRIKTDIEGELSSAALRSGMSALPATSSAHAEMLCTPSANRPAPMFTITLTFPALPVTTTASGAPSPLRSPAISPIGWYCTAVTW